MPSLWQPMPSFNPVPRGTSSWLSSFLLSSKVALLRELSSTNFYVAFGWEYPRKSLGGQDAPVSLASADASASPVTPSLHPRLEEKGGQDAKNPSEAEARAVRKRSVSWGAVQKPIEELPRCRPSSRNDEAIQGSAMSGARFMSALQQALCRPEGDRHALELLNTIAACCEVL